MPNGVDDHQTSPHSCLATKTEKPSRSPSTANQDSVKQAHSVPIWLCKLVLKQEAKGVSGAKFSVRNHYITAVCGGQTHERWRKQMAMLWTKALICRIIRAQTCS